MKIKTVRKAAIDHSRIAVLTRYVLFTMLHSRGFVAFKKMMSCVCSEKMDVGVFFSADKKERKREHTTSLQHEAVC